MNGDIDGADYKTIKSDAEHKMLVLEAKISELRTDFINLREVANILDSAIRSLVRLDEIYCKSDTKLQRRIIGSMYPEKFTFEDLQHRTAAVSDTFNVIYMINKQLQDKKNGTTDRNSVLSQRVIPLGFEPRTPTLKVLCSTS